MTEKLANVLIVDDLEDDLYMTRRFLGEPRGMRCIFLEARDGKAALERIAALAASGEPIDLVLLDINMPVMNGFEMLERMHEDPAMSKIPVVMQTGSTYEKDRDRARELGAVGYIEKPVQFSALSKALEPVNSVRLVGQPPALVRA
ncbi:MAG: response regulator [Alphaproteobacteria bacterium]|nr:response regulator [Alphaproteobacteria bacterium]